MAAALELIDDVGLAGLTTRRLAVELGTFQPAIYRRVASRDALLDLVADAVMAEAGLPEADRSDWRAWLRECALRIRGAWRRHPHAAPLMHHGGAHPAIVQILGGIVEVFASNGFDEDDLPACLQVYLGYVFGTTLLETTGHADAAPSGSVEDAGLRARLGQIAGSAGSRDQVFLNGLDIVLDGLAGRRNRRPSL